MPHLSIQYSSNLDERSNISSLCEKLAQEIAAMEIYPLGGIRVRAVAHDHYAIADNHPDNAFLDMVFRIGQGRTTVEKVKTGERLMVTAQQHFKNELNQEHFMLSLEIIEISKQLSWKLNTVHPRLARNSKI